MSTGRTVPRAAFSRIMLGAGGKALCGIVNLSRGGILLALVARRFGAEKSLARL